MELKILLVSALSIGFLHTLVGPDHYLPFIVLSKARKWSLNRTVFITTLCGIGHVAGSIALGFLGIALGIAVNSLVSVENVRGEIAAWFLIAFGLVYGVWGLRQAWKKTEHSHAHDHGDGIIHTHSHAHHHDHIHLHGENKNITPWVLFIIFVLGPCEPLIPLLMYPAAKGDWWSVWMVSLIFGAITVVTMVTMVALVSKGLMHLKTEWMEKYMHALAGFIIAFSGLSIQVFGL